MGEINVCVCFEPSLDSRQVTFFIVFDKHFIAGAQSGLFKKDVRFHFTPPRAITRVCAGSIQYKQDSGYFRKWLALISELSRKRNEVIDRMVVMDGIMVQQFQFQIREDPRNL